MTLEQIQTQMMAAIYKENYYTALEMAQKAVNITTNEKQAWCILNVVDILIKLKRFTRAREEALKAGQLLQDIYGVDSYEFSYVCSYLGKIYFHLQKYEVSMHCFEFFIDRARIYLQTVEDFEEKIRLELLLEDARIGILTNISLLNLGTYNFR